MEGSIQVKVLGLGVVVVVILGSYASSLGDSDAPGRIRLLEGYAHKQLQGFDSAVGRIANEKLSISYDIGPLAGVKVWPGRNKEYLWYKEQQFLNNVVRVALRKDNVLLVTFPHSSANFTAKVEKNEDIVDVLLMTLTFRQKQLPIYKNLGKNRIRGSFEFKAGQSEPARPARPVRHGKLVTYWVDTGFKSQEHLYCEGRFVRGTTWTFNGKVLHQSFYLGKDEGGVELSSTKDEPPWWWGVGDQTEPTASWWNKKDR